MLTSRAWWLIAAALTMLILGVLGGEEGDDGLPILTLVALALLLWITGNAILFAFRARWACRDLVLERVLYDNRGVARTLWAQRNVEVRTVLRLNGILPFPYLQVEELIPFGAKLTRGTVRIEGALRPNSALEIFYELKPLASGRIRFEGAVVQIGDLHGLFYHKTFVRLEREYLVLPDLAHGDTKTAMHKNQNVLMPPGINQLALPGSGSELLDLRDYIPGDPPKTIAWKVSARRDRLITKEYESEVPMRCNLLVDASASVQLGAPGGTPHSRLVEIAASVAQANLSSRDLTGLCTFDEESIKVLRPARSRRHLIEILNVLAKSEAPLRPTDQVEVESLIPLACSFAEEVYPEQMGANVNRVPFWLPLISPAPCPAARKPTTSTHLFRCFFGPLLVLLYLGIALSFYSSVLLPRYRALPQDIADKVNEVLLKRDPIEVQGNWERLTPPLDLVSLTFWIVVLFLLPVYLKIFREVIPMIFSPGPYRRMRYRKRLAALLAVRYDLGPGGPEMLYQDDKKLARFLQRFLREHRVPFTPRLHDEQGRYVFASPKKIDVLTKALLAGITKGRDNELFVLFVDVVELEDHLQRLLGAIKVALARHHKVMLVVPWPADVPVPRDDADGDSVDEEARKLRRAEQALASDNDDGLLASYLDKLARRSYLRSFLFLRQTLGRLQVPVICAADESSVEMILDRLDRMRGHRRQRISTV